MRYFLWIDGKKQGPYDEDQIRDMLGGGVAPTVALTLEENGSDEWMSTHLPTLIGPEKEPPPVAKKYYIIQSDETKGPYTLGQLRALWNSGTITSETLHSQEGYSEWLPLSAVIQELEPPAAPPPIEPTPQAQFYPPQPQPKRKGVGTLGVILGLLVLVVIIQALVSSSPSSSSGKATRTMSIKVFWGFDSIRIRNTGSADLSGQTMTVYLNGMPPFAYKADWPAPAVGETVTIPLTVFVKNGSRFNPTTQAVSEAWIGGAGYDFDKYGK